MTRYTDVSDSISGRHTAAGGLGSLYGQPAARVRPDTEAEQLARVWAQEERWRAEQWAMVVRGAVASRLELFSARHAEHAWQARNSFGIGPVAIALLHVEPQHEPETRLAGKLFPDSDATRDARDVLFNVCEVTDDILDSGGDVRAELCEAPEDVSVFAQYAGAAVSLLDLGGGGSWRDTLRNSAGGGLYLPGRIVALLADGTRLVADRYELRRHPHYVVQASNRLGADWSRFGRVSRYRPELTDDNNPGSVVDGGVWNLLRELNEMIVTSGSGSR